MVIHQYASMVLYLFIFFFKQKTAYEVRISDWSSDVCSSNLAQPGGSPPAPPVDRQRRPGRGLCLPVDLRPGSGARACIEAARSLCLSHVQRCFIEPIWQPEGHPPPPLGSRLRGALAGPRPLRFFAEIGRAHV